MSIASQITALGNNIGAAYNMINQRGGTIPARKNAENMATAIATIPSGGPTKDYGTVTIADYYYEWSVRNAYNCTATVTDSDTFLAAVEAHPEWGWNGVGYTLQCRYNVANAGWRFNNDNTYYTTAQVAEFGISITNATLNNSTYVYLEYAFHLDTSSTTTVSISNYLEYESLGANDYFRYDGAYYPKAAIVGYSFGNDCDYLPVNFMNRCTNFNQNITIPNTITEISDYFLTGCTSFNSSISISSSVTKIDNNFLASCSSFNKTITIPDSVESIGNSFMYSLQNYNNTITLGSGLKSIGNDFMMSCRAFDTQLNIPNGLESIGEQFMRMCNAYSGTMVLPSSLTKIGNNFMMDCQAFNSPIDASSIEAIPSGFLGNCQIFNSNVTLSSSLKSIGNSFIYACPLFNKPITLPEGLTKIGDMFLYGASSFNQPLTLPSTLTSIGDYFLSSCSSFTQPLTIPSSVTIMTGSYSMYCMNNFTGPLTVNTTAHPSGTNVLATNSNSALCYTTGITIKGSARSTWISALPNRTSSPYRKLINGGA